MMAGVVPRRSTSGRKQWTIRDGPRNSLKSLRSHLASEGCSESQVVLAKQLLDEQNEADHKENARLGVYWLIKASEQGNIEATELLKNCLETGKGISELNYLDVKSCITMSQEEKLTRRAAREMFASLSNGGDYITSDQLQRKILAIDNMGTLNIEKINLLEDSDSEEEDWTQKFDDNNEKLTEDHLLSAAVDYSHGQLPLVNRILCFQSELKMIDQIPYIQRSILHPFLTFKLIYYKFIKFFGSKFNHFSIFIMSELQIISLMLIYTLINSNNLIYFIPLLIYCVSFIIMLITTCQMLQSRRDYHDYRLWSGLFICYSGGSLNPEQAEYQYICNNLKPYAHFFVALLINLLIYPIISEQWLPQSELTIICFCFIFLSLFNFMPNGQYDYLILLSFAVNVLAKYPYETDAVVAQGWRYLDLNIPTYTSYIIGNGIEFCINFRILLYAIIPIILLKLALKDNWKGTYKILIPHCVTLSWLQLCIINSQGATMYGLLRGTLALGFILFLPLLGIISIILPALALTKWIFTTNILFISGFLLFFFIGFFIVRFLSQGRLKKLTASIQIITLFISTYFLINSIDLNKTNNLYYNEQDQFLSWDNYQKFCNQPIWQEENVAVAQLKCAQLDNTYVQWDGYIDDIKIKSIKNSWKYIIEKFPIILRSQLTCLIGENYINDCDKFPHLLREDCMNFYNLIKETYTCSLEQYNIYTFEITVKMHAGIWGKSPIVTLIANNDFRNFTLLLKPSDHIWFYGRLFNNELVGSDGILGSKGTYLNLEGIVCLACANNKLTEMKFETNTNDNIIYLRKIYYNLTIGFKFLLNVIFNPIVIFK